MASNVGTVNVNLALGRCKDCKWWSADDAASRSFACEPIGVMRICEHPKLGDPSTVTNDADALRYEHDEGGMIETGPEFGCIHFEEKPLERIEDGAYRQHVQDQHLLAALCRRGLCLEGESFTHFEQRVKPKDS